MFYKRPPLFEERVTLLNIIYKATLGRDIDESGLETYSDFNIPLEVVYAHVYKSDEAISYRERLEEKKLKEELEKSKVLPLSLVIMARDAEDCIHLPINSLKDIVREVVVLDSGSVDRTVEVSEELGAIVYKTMFNNNFGELRTLAAGLASSEFVFMLDSDELVLEEDLVKLALLLYKMKNDDVDIVGVPRRRWRELEMENEVHPDVFPDLQFRLFKNKPEIKYVRRVHEVITGSDKIYEAIEDGPVIQHFQDSFKYGKALEKRNALYKELQTIDINDGVEHTEDAFEEVDRV